MLSTACAVLAAIVAVLPFGPADDPEWQVLSSAPGRFTIKMPGEANVQEAQAPGPNGPVPFIVASVKGDDFAYIVMSTTPGAAKTKEEIDKVLIASLDQVETDLKGKSKSKRSTWNGKTGTVRYQLTAKPENGLPAGECDGQLIFDGDRLYQVMAIGPAASRPDREAFIASFRPSAAAPAGAPKGEAAAQPKGGMKNYAAAKGGFSADWPAKPENQSIRKPNDRSTTEMRVYVVSERDGTEYGVTFTEFVADPQPGPAEFSKRVAEEVAKRDKGTVRSGRELKLGDVVGYEVQFDSPASPQSPAGTTVARVFTVGKRSYTAMVFGPGKKATDETATRFLNSFKLIEGNPPAPAAAPKADAKAKARAKTGIRAKRGN